MVPDTIFFILWFPISVSAKMRMKVWIIIVSEVTFMTRKVHFDEEEFVLRLTGVESIFALKWQMKIPYKAIKKVYIDEYDPPMWMLKMPGTAVAPLHIYEGSFKFGNEWYFLSFEHNVPFLHLEIEGAGKYKYVIIELENPKAVMIELRKRIRELEA